MYKINILMDVKICFQNTEICNLKFGIQRNYYFLNISYVPNL